MKICRLCLCTDDNSSFKSFDAKVTSDLSFVCGISPIEHNCLGTALVCSSCCVNLSSAATLKKVALLAQIFFKKRVEEFEKQEDTPGPDEGDYENLIEYSPKYVADTGEEFIDEEDLLELEIESTPTQESSRLPAGQESSVNKAHQVFASSQRLLNHSRSKHEHVPVAELVPCKACSKKFKTKEYLDLHVKNLHSNAAAKLKQGHPCPTCEKVLSSQVALKNHKEKHFIESQPCQAKKFTCDFCGMAFRLKSYIFNHMNNMHMTIRKYQCSYCERNFYKKYEMNDHTRQYHTLETPFRCEFEGCSKSFSRKKNYLIHKRIHTGCRPYPCIFPGCDRAFMHFIDRKRHLMKHTGHRPFPCTQAGCDKSFMRQNELKSHLKSHCSF